MSYFPAAKDFADRLRALIKSRPVLILLEGPLGAGKTTWVKEILAELDFAKDEVQSPTFLKLLEYRNMDKQLCLHIDAYRFEDASEVETLALETYEYVNFIFVEWPEKFLEYLESRPSLVAVLGNPLRIRVRIDAQHVLTILD